MNISLMIQNHMRKNSLFFFHHRDKSVNTLLTARSRVSLAIGVSRGHGKMQFCLTSYTPRNSPPFPRRHGANVDIVRRCFHNRGTIVLAFWITCSGYLWLMALVIGRGRWVVGS